MTQNTYFLHLQNSIVVGFHSDDMDPEFLPRGEKTIKVLTNEPSKYLGLDEKQIFLDPLPEVEHDVTDKESLDYRRQELKRLFYEIQFTQGILEDAKDLEALYEVKLREYNELKEPIPAK
jgi:hypothetical protein